MDQRQVLAAVFGFGSFKIYRASRVWVYGTVAVQNYLVQTRRTKTQHVV
jgi:hypothetical protein